MPSSSTRSTFLERHLHFHFKLCYTRLHSSGYLSQAEFVLQEFGRVLDIEPGELHGTIKPIYDPNHKTREQHHLDVKAWHKLCEDNRNMVRSKKVFEAGSALAEAAAALNAVSRKQEADLFCEWGDELWRMAFDEEEKEKRWKAFSHYGGEMIY